MYQDSESSEELNRVISDSIIPDGPDDEKSSDVGESSEAPTTVTGIHDKEVVPNDAYFNMEFGLPRGSYNELIHALVKRSNLDEDGKPIDKEHINLLN